MKPRWRISAAVTLALVLAQCVPPAYAQISPMSCLPHEAAVNKLEQGYGEQRAGLGISPDGGAVYELYVSPDGETWTILITRTNGLTCIAASGESWMFQSRVKPPLLGFPL